MNTQVHLFQTKNRLSALFFILITLFSNTVFAVCSVTNQTDTLNSPYSSINTALSEASPFHILVVSGACIENVVINMDGITLKGGTSGIIKATSGQNDAIFIDVKLAKQSSIFIPA